MTHTADMAAPARVQPPLTLRARLLIGISDAVDRLTAIAYVAAVAAFLTIMIAGVFFRYVLNSSLYWSDELALIIFIWAAFLSITTGYLHGHHIRFDFLLRRAPASWQGTLEIVAEGLAAAYLICLLVSGWHHLGFVTRMSTTALGWSAATHFLAIPVCAFLMLIHWSRRNLTACLPAAFAKLAIAAAIFWIFYLPFGAHVSVGGWALLALTIALFFIPALLGVPIALVLGLVSTLYVGSQPSTAFSTISQQTFLGLETVVLIAIPLLILAGTIMHASGIAARMVDFAQVIVGRVRGGLGASNVAASYIFGDISGSAVSDTAAIGAIMIPEMKRKGYKPDFCAALQGASGTLGMLAPLSVTLLMYCSAINVSVSRMALATIIPALVLTVSFMLWAMWHGARNGYPRERVPAGEIVPRTLRAIPGLASVVLILGGVLGGIFTPAEVGAVLVLYILFISVVFYRLRDPKALYRLVLEAGYVSGMTLFLVSTSNVLGFVLSLEGVGQIISAAFLGLTENKLIIIAIVSVVFIVLGMFLEAPPMIFAFLPSFMPLLMGVHVDPLHWGVLFLTNMGLGMIFPPIAVNLFISTSLAGVSYEKAVRASIPFIIIMLINIALLAVFPQIVLLLPHLVFGHPI